jgi:enoyl-CoA hydratase/carnithine racemase
MQMLPKAVRKKNALEIFLTAKVINAQQALQVGLVDAIVEKPLDFVLEKLL